MRNMLEHETQAIFFDAGFTLVEPKRPVAEVYAAEAAALDVPLGEELNVRLSELKSAPEETVRQRFGKSVDLRSSEEIERQAWHRFTAALAQPFPLLSARHAEWLARLVAHFDSPDAWQPLPDAENLLSSLKTRYRLAVVSNWHGALPAILDGVGLGSFFDTIITSSTAGFRKPHRAIFQHAIDQLGVAVDSVVHVGDSWSEDVLGAQAAGLRAIHFDRRSTGNSPATPDGHQLAGVIRINKLRDLPAAIQSVESHLHA